ncbi:MAG TPA: UDP-N-acetylmuramate:L-alanyl-gamma-D-glutamyl-meso-diaminopimelate ligase, partial [Rudaea sp.]|nr:UDP-N-acetylmuramate:L-alanyl-gamma-D-glutamyl-meso-diaminopimelate ligase [Rudaea sp.]
MTQPTLQNLHILGICGTFMGGVAALAREMGYHVEGSDANIYPPMSDQLAALGVTLKSGYAAAHLQPSPDLVIVGNALSRGNAAVEHMLDARLSYTSGPQWIGEQVLASRRVFAVAGTHGKTTTTSMLAWMLEACGREPGFLVGGVPENFGVSARLGATPALSAQPSALSSDFVIEADEYDTAFFDKRSKFVHYRPHIAILNNLEYDHADIFPDVAAIQRQFHHLVRIVPRNGRLIVNAEDARLAEVLAMGSWTPITTFGMDSGDWRARVIAADGSHFAVLHEGCERGEVRWGLLGRHNVMNALAAIAAAHSGGVAAAQAIAALADFRNAKRRMELVGERAGIHVYDDFAHHPTAIATTLAGLRARVGDARILVGMEPRSNSMRLGAHADELAPSLRDADEVVFLQRPELVWDAARVTASLHGRGHTAASVDVLVSMLR